jgi:hypothetical protein
MHPTPITKILAHALNADRRLRRPAHAAPDIRGRLARPAPTVEVEAIDARRSFPVEGAAGTATSTR